MMLTMNELKEFLVDDGHDLFFEIDGTKIMVRPYSYDDFDVDVGGLITHIDGFDNLLHFEIRDMPLKKILPTSDIELG